MLANLSTCMKLYYCYQHYCHTQMNTSHNAAKDCNNNINESEVKNTPAARNSFMNRLQVFSKMKPPEHQRFRAGASVDITARGEHGSSVDTRRRLSTLAGTPVITRMRIARRVSEGEMSYLRAVFFVIMLTLCSTLLVLMSMSLPITKIVMGAVFFNDCPAEPWITRYLVLGGGIACSRDLWTIIMKCILSERDFTKHEISVSTISVFISTIEIAVFGAGSFFVYRTYGSFQSEDKDDPRYCCALLYWFAFWIVTLTHAIILFLTASICVAFCIAQSRPQPTTTIVHIEMIPEQNTEMERVNKV